MDRLSEYEYITDPRKWIKTPSNINDAMEPLIEWEHAVALFETKYDEVLANNTKVIALKRKATEWGAQEGAETISSLTGRWEALCNWFPCNVMVRGVPYKSIEHAFQAAKAGDDGEVTLEFVKEMLEYQKSQKNIHKKCVSL